MGKYKQQYYNLQEKQFSHMKSLQRKNCGMKCRQSIKEKNIARMECLQQKTRTNQEHYKEKRKK